MKEPGERITKGKINDYINRYKPFLVLLSVLGITLLVIFFHGYPLWLNILEMREENAQLEEVLATAHIPAFPSTREDRLQIEREIRMLNFQLYSLENLPHYFVELESLLFIREGQEYRISMGEVVCPQETINSGSKGIDSQREPQGKDEGEELVQHSFFEIDVSFSASLTDILLYIKRLENYPALQVQSLVIKEGDGYYNLFLNLRAYLSTRLQEEYSSRGKNNNEDILET